MIPEIALDDKQYRNYELFKKMDKETLAARYVLQKKEWFINGFLLFLVGFCIGAVMIIIVVMAAGGCIQ